MSRRILTQRGFSLVELMIALTLGLIVTGAILQTFVMNNRSIEIQRSTIALQEQGRAAVDYISRYARLAGFREDDLSTPVLTNAIAGTGSSIVLRFRGENAANTTVPLRDCQGNVVTAGNTSQNAFTVSGSVMSCYIDSNYDGTLDTTSDAVLVDNVHDSLFLFGEDTDSNQSPNLYRTAAQVSDWEDVVALKLCLVLESSNNVLDTAAAIPAIMCDGSDSASTSRLLRKIETTIALRNRTGS